MPPMWLKMVVIAAGAVAGAYARYFLEEWMKSGWAVWIINSFACLLMGVVLGYLSVCAWSQEHKDLFHLLVLTGFAGGFATFAHYIYYCVEYFKAGQAFLSFVYFATSLVAGFAFLLGGYWLGERL